MSKNTTKSSSSSAMSHPDGPIMKNDSVAAQGQIENVEEDEYKVYWYRWVVVFLFALIGHNNSVMFCNLAYLGGPLNQVYGVPSNLVLLLFTATSYMIFVLFSIPSLFVANFKNGLYYAANIAAWSMFVGQILRFAQPAGSWYLLEVGSLIAFINAPFILGGFTQLSKNWFPERERALATAISIFGNQLGMVTPTFLLRLVCSEDCSDEEVLAGFRQLNIAATILTGFSAFATLFFFRTRAPTPPSPVVASHDIPFMKSMKACFCNWRFMFVTIAFGITGSWLWDLGFLTEALLDEAPGYTSTQAANVATAMTAVTIVGIFLAGFLLDKFHDYYWTPTIAIAVGVITYAVQITIADREYSSANYAIVFLCSCLFTFALGMAETIMLEYGAELSYPAREQHSALLMYLSAMIMGIINLVTDAGNGFVFNGDTMKSGWLWTAILGFAFLLMVSTYGFKLKRRAAESVVAKRTHPSDSEDDHGNLKV